MPLLYCRHRRVCFYCQCHHRCHRAIALPLTDAATKLFLPPSCCAARRCRPTATLPAVTMLPPPLPHCRRGCQLPPLPRRCYHCCAAATTTALLPPLLMCCQHRHHCHTNDAAAAALLLLPRCRQAAAAAITFILFFVSSPPPTMLRCCRASGNAAALPPRWLRWQINGIAPAPRPATQCSKIWW